MGTVKAISSARCVIAKLFADGSSSGNIAGKHQNASRTREAPEIESVSPLYRWRRAALLM
jgi:hypothetical protein